MFTIIKNIILGISVAVPVGPSGVEIINRGLKHGFLSAFVTSLGVASADITYLLLIFFGLSPVLSIPLVRKFIGIFGVIVLISLGIKHIKAFFNKEKKKVVKKSTKNSFFTGYLITLTNPMTIVWWVGIFGTTLIPTIVEVPRIVALLNSLTIIIGILLWFFTLSLMLHWGRRFVNEKRIISLMAGIVLIGFGIYLGYGEIISIL